MVQPLYPGPSSQLSPTAVRAGTCLELSSTAALAATAVNRSTPRAAALCVRPPGNYSARPLVLDIAGHSDDNGQERAGKLLNRVLSHIFFTGNGNGSGTAESRTGSGINGNTETNKCGR